jgi:tyrosine-protein kinase Etk/Wzc
VKQESLAAETDLKLFQETHRLVSIGDQARAAIEGAAKIKGEIISAQTELEVVKEFGTERQNKVVMLKSRIRELENQLGKIEKGNNELPALGLEFARRMREAKIQEEIFQLITIQHELAKIDEAKDMNTIQMLDRAVPPDKKSGPPRVLIIILVSTVALFVSIFIAYYFEYLRSTRADLPQA